MIKTVERTKSWNREDKWKDCLDDVKPKGRIERYDEKYRNKCVDQEMEVLTGIYDETPCL